MRSMRVRRPPVHPKVGPNGVQHQHKREPGQVRSGQGTGFTPSPELRDRPFDGPTCESDRSRRGYRLNGPAAKFVSRCRVITPTPSLARVKGCVRRAGRTVLGSLPVEAHRQHARDVKGCAPAPSLIWCRQEVPSATIERGAAGPAHRRQQRQFGHFDRGLIGVGAIAERAGHAAATGLDGFDVKTGNEPKHLFDRLERAE